VLINGAAGSTADLRIGMVANVQGTIGADLTMGVAGHIEVCSVAQGPVSHITTKQFSVAGMAVMTDVNTVFDGFSTLAGLAALPAGQGVTVWGLQASADASRWTATRVATTPSTPLVSTGLVVVNGVANSAQKFINGVLLTGAGVSALSASQLARVQGQATSGANNTGNGMLVDSILLLGASTPMQPSGDADIEGLVTTVLAARRFILGSVEVDATTAVLSTAGASISVGQRLEVEGTWQGRVLKAAKCSFEDAQEAQTIEIEAKIEQFTSLANFVVRGQRCDGSAVTQIGNGKVSDLKVGVKVHVQGMLMGNVLKLSSIEINS
jgi:hypothetical protein